MDFVWALKWEKREAQTNRVLFIHFLMDTVTLKEKRQTVLDFAYSFIGISPCQAEASDPFILPTL